MVLTLFVHLCQLESSLQPLSEDSVGQLRVVLSLWQQMIYQTLQDHESLARLLSILLSNYRQIKAQLAQQCTQQHCLQQV